MAHVSRLLEKPSCETCRFLYEEQGQEPPCDECLPPLLPENEEAAEVYMMVRNQLILAPMGGPVDIDIQAVDVAVRRAKPEHPDHVFFSVIRLARTLLAKQQEGRG